MAKGTEIAIVDKFEITNINDDIKAVIVEEMDGLGMIPFEIVKMPSGGGLTFQIGDDDDPEIEKELRGVIVYHHPVNTFWRESYSGNNAQPDCASYDGKTGVRTETGEVVDCESCPYNQYGSAENGRGKACKNSHRLYILREGEMIPVILSLPPSSLKELKNYIAKKIVLKGRRAFECLTKITLKKDVNADGIAYSKAVFSKEGELSREIVDSLMPTIEWIKEMALSESMARPIDIEEKIDEDDPFR